MSDCVFCDIIRREAEASYVYEDDATLAFMDLRQANPGHVLIVPKKHVATLYELDPQTAARLFQSAVHVSQAVMRVFTPEGLNLWQSNGEVAGQEIFHVHLHLQPRFAGDGLFNIYPVHPPVTARAELDQLAARLRQAL